MALLKLSTISCHEFPALLISPMVYMPGTLSHIGLIAIVKHLERVVIVHLDFHGTGKTAHSQDINPAAEEVDKFVSHRVIAFQFRGDTARL
jgi:hypothetical protein